MSDEMYGIIQAKMRRLALEGLALSKSKKPKDKQRSYQLSACVEVCAEILGSGSPDSEERIKALFLEVNCQ